MVMKCLLALSCLILDFAHTQIDRSKIAHPDLIYFDDEGERYPPTFTNKHEARGRSTPNFNAVQPSAAPFAETSSYGTNLLADNVVGTNILEKIPRDNYDNAQQAINPNFPNPFGPPVQFPYQPNFFNFPPNLNFSPNLNNFPPNPIFPGNVNPQGFPQNAPLNYPNDNPNIPNNNVANNVFPQNSGTGNINIDARPNPPQRPNTNAIYQPTERYDGNNPNNNFGNNAFLQSSNSGQNDIRNTPPKRINMDPTYQPITESFVGNDGNNNFGNNAFLQSNNAGNRQNNVRPTQGIPTDSVYQQATERYDGNQGSIRNNATLDPVALSISHFGLKVMEILKAQHGNTVISPFSIATLLALLQQGANGNTQEQISKALMLTPRRSLSGFRQYLGTIRNSQSRIILNVANGVFVNTNFNINPNYLASAVDNFGSEVKPVMFERSAVAVRAINKWASDKTNHKIQNLLSQDSISPDTQMVLVNAVFFKGQWAVKFRPESTVQRDFHLGNGRTKPASFMRTRRYFKADVDRGINSEILILPFQGESYSLVLILPSEMYTVNEALAALTKEKLVQYQDFTSKEVAVEIPKFNAKSDTDLFQVFQRMGIVDLFSQNADLSGIGNSNGYSPRVSSAVHSAMLSIDEQGGVAAASTAFAAIALSNDDPMLTFVANRPFIAVLWDNEHSTPLFMAKIVDPVTAT